MSTPLSGQATAARLTSVDLARTAAIVMMVVYHVTYDLDAIFGLIPRGTAFAPPFSTLAKATAGSFLAIAGLSLVLAHGAGIRWRAVRMQMLKVGGAALLITVATYAAMPQSFVYFGILHAIATFSLLGLALVRLPVIAPILAFAVVLALWAFVGRTLFDTVWLGWTGLSSEVRETVDFEPLVPWMLPFLGGMILGKVGVPILRSLSPQGRLVHALCWPGRHSLVIYLVHQPILIGLIWTVTQVL